MKGKVLSLFFFSTVVLFAIISCTKDDSNPLSNSNFSGIGSDYLPLSSGHIINAMVSGSATEYDSLGRVTDFSQISNEPYNSTIGASTFLRNVNAFPIFGNNNNQSELAGYLSNNNGEIIGFDNVTNSQSVVVLPAELSAGKEWVINPNSPVNEQFKAKLIENLISFTNSAGRTFQNVIKIEISYNDLSSGTYDPPMNGSWYEKRDIEGNIFLAKGVGIVGAIVNNYEHVEKVNVSYSFFGNITQYGYYKKIKASGEIGITN